MQHDLLFVKNENLNTICNQGLLGAPDMIIEILSPSTSQLDYEEKKSAYKTLGVQEYFIFDPNTNLLIRFF